MQVTIFTDGSARGNPNGPGGCGSILQYVDRRGVLHEKEISVGYEKTTNNRMELMAAILALEALNRPCEVDLYSDSHYLIDPFQKHWIDKWIRENWREGKPNAVKNRDLWERLLRALSPHQIRFHWVKGHADHPENNRCDALATAAADGDHRIPDPGI